MKFGITGKITMNLRSYIREFPDFPKKGIMFKDISPILKSHEALEHINTLFTKFANDHDIDLIAGIESRGLVFSSILAMTSKRGFFMVRKEGKLPGDTMPMAYDLEYGNSVIEIQRDAVQPGQRVLIIDDLLATGGTARTAAKLVEKAGGIVAGYAFVVELTALNGRAILEHNNILTLVTYND